MTTPLSHLNHLIWRSESRTSIIASSWTVQA
ncbi:hypothetical protein AAZX31_07G151800 [Glycine max]